MGHKSIMEQLVNRTGFVSIRPTANGWFSCESVITDFSMRPFRLKILHCMGKTPEESIERMWDKVNAFGRQLP